MELFKLEDFKSSPDYETALSLIRKLYNTRFIHRDFDAKSRDDYDFIRRYKDYIGMMVNFSGFELVVSEVPGREVAYVQGVSTENCQRFNKEESKVFLRLLYNYIEQATVVTARTDASAYVTAGDLLQQVNATRTVSAGKMELGTLKSILYMFESNQIVKVEGKRKDFSYDTPIIILSSIPCVAPMMKLEDIAKRLETYAVEGRKSSIAALAQDDDQVSISEEKEGEE